MTVLTRRSSPIVVALATAALLAGCSKPADEPEASANVSFEDEAPRAEREPNTAPVEPAPVAKPPNLVDDEREGSIPPPEHVSRDAQMLEDADATGMTARLPAHGDDDRSADNDHDDAARQ